MTLTNRVLGSIAVIGALLPGLLWWQLSSLQGGTSNTAWMAWAQQFVDKPGNPVHIAIASIGVDAKVEQVGLDDKGAMAAPQDWDNAGWYELGPRPGENGNAVLAGHLDSKTSEAVFWHLHRTKPGDEVVITDQYNQTWTYVIREKKQFHESKVPLTDIFSSTGPARLILLTCAGVWSNSLADYSQRYAVYADLVK